MEPLGDGLWAGLIADLEPHEFTYRQRFTFADGENGETYGRLLEVWIDPPADTSEPTSPAGVYLLDENLLNNAWRAERNREPVLYRGIRMMLEAQSRLSFAGLIG